MAPESAPALPPAMSTPDTLLQAALNRLAARASSSAIDAAAQLSLLAQDAPQKIRTDLQLFLGGGAG